MKKATLPWPTFWPATLDGCVFMIEALLRAYRGADDEVGLTRSSILGYLGISERLREVTNMSVEGSLRGVQENLGALRLKEGRKTTCGDYRSYRLRLGPTSKMLCHMGLGRPLDALQAAFEIIPIAGTLATWHLAELREHDGIPHGTLATCELDETSDEWPPEEKFQGRGNFRAAQRGNVEKWYKEHCDMHPY